DGSADRGGQDKSNNTTLTKNASGRAREPDRPKKDGFEIGAPCFVWSLKDGPRRRTADAHQNTMHRAERRTGLSKQAFCGGGISIASSQPNPVLGGTEVGSRHLGPFLAPSGERDFRAFCHELTRGRETEPPAPPCDEVYAILQP